jgi:predicted naringenin-chalcone synthase
MQLPRRPPQLARPLLHAQRFLRCKPRTSSFLRACLRREFVVPCCAAASTRACTQLLRSIVAGSHPSPETAALLDKVISRCGIETRHTVTPPSAEGFRSALEGSGPRARGALWEAWAPAMAVAAARDALGRWPHGSAADITHVVAHSCTGFMAPGLECALIAGMGARG